MPCSFVSVLERITNKHPEDPKASEEYINLSPACYHHHKHIAWSLDSSELTPLLQNFLGIEILAAV